MEGNLLDDAHLVACLLGAIVDVGEAFWRMSLEGERSSVVTQISMKAPVCGGDFSTRLIERSISHHKQKRGEGLPKLIQNVEIQLANRHR